MEMIYDYETLGQDTRVSPILALSVLIYDPERFLSYKPYTFEELCGMTRYFKYDIKDQVVNHGKKIDMDTLEWWKGHIEHNPNLKEILDPSPDDLPIEKLWDNFVEVIGYNKIEKVFTRGNSYDPVFTDFIFRDLGKDPVYNYYELRDTRSYIEALLIGTDLKQDFIPLEVEDVFEAHNPIHDVVVDVLRMQSVIRELFKDDIPPF